MSLGTFIIWKINSVLVWAAGPVMKKNVGQLWATFLGGFFTFWGAKKNFKNILATALKSYIKRLF